MALTMRPTGLGHGVYKDSIDYGVFSGDWCIGRIYENRSGPEDQRQTLPGPKATSRAKGSHRNLGYLA